MNIYKTLNEITAYIDEHLEEKISFALLAKKMGVSIYSMQRIFVLLTNITLTDYIRKRRLSQAGEELYMNKIKIMDLALKYGYENATSFSRAFYKFHKIKPSAINEQTKLTIFPRIVFDEKVDTQEPISYEIIELGEFTLYGKAVKTDNEDIKKTAPSFFKKMNKLYGFPQYGMVTYHEETRLNAAFYWVMYENSSSQLQKVVIPPNKWLKFRIPTQEAPDIQRMSQKFYIDILPSCKYDLTSSLPELEYYHDDITDFLVPINPKYSLKISKKHNK